MTPGLNLAQGSVNKPQYAVAMAQAYNSMILDLVTGGHDEVVTAMVVPPTVPDKAAELIVRFAPGSDFRAIHMPPSNVQPPIDYERYEPISDAAAR